MAIWIASLKWTERERRGEGESSAMCERREVYFFFICFFENGKTKISLKICRKMNGAKVG